MLIGLLGGLTADLMGHERHVNVLAPVVWAVVVWNLAIYALLLLQALRRGSPAPGWVRKLVALWWHRGATQGPVAVAAQRWAELSSGLSSLRASVLVHVAAAAFGLGLMAGLYVRALGLDYRAGWESTFLEPGTVHAVLAVLMAPALAASGLNLPDLGAVAAMRVTPQQPLASASAALWIHLYAATVMLLVVLPRTLLAAAAAWRAGWLSRRLLLGVGPLAPWRLDQGRTGVAAPLVQVLPYAQTPAAHTALGLRQLLAAALGDALVLKMADVTAIGSEDSVAARAGPPGTTLRVALVDMTATPEAEHHGRWCNAMALLADGVQWLLVLDEAAYRTRFGSLPGRLAERRQAWQAFAEQLGARLAIVNLDQPEHADSRAALQHALNP